MKLILILLFAISIPIAWLTIAGSADEPAADKDQKSASQPDKNANSRAADEEAIRNAGKAFVDAYNARDAKKLASLYTPEAVYLDPLTGEESVGREAIEKDFADAFADNQEVKLKADPKSIEFVSPNVAISRGTAQVIRPGAEPVNSEYTIVRVKRDGQWLVDRVSEIEKEKPAPSNYEHLKDLAWMIGSWRDDDPRPAVEIQTDCDWAKNKNFMTRSFAVAIGDQVNQAGMQIIGWDPNAKQIRSWVFDSDGGYGEGTWTQKGERWYIQNIATLPDGGKASSVNIITRLDDNSFKWESVNREIDGDIQPNVDPVTVVRKTDQANKQNSNDTEVQQ